MESRSGVHIFDNKKEMTDFMLKKWKTFSREYINGKGTFVVALSGGTTPRDFYRKLAETGEDPTWSRIHLFLADERFVPFTDPDSNYGMLNDLLLCKVNIPMENRHPVPVGEASPDRSATKYEDEIRAFFKIGTTDLPEFDLVMLGIGEDGHTASLFPGAEVLKDRTHITFPVYLDRERHDRITLTLHAINNSKNIIFLVAGANKAEVTRKVLKERNASLPASLVKPNGGILIFLLDRDAGSCL